MNTNHASNRPAGDDDHVPGARLRELLQWLADGIDIPEAARRLNRRPRAVEQHLAAALARLGAATPAEALEKLAAAAAAQPAADAPAEAPPAAA